MFMLISYYHGIPHGCSDSPDCSKEAFLQLVCLTQHPNKFHTVPQLIWRLSLPSSIKSAPPTSFFYAIYLLINTGHLSCRIPHNWDLADYFLMVSTHLFLQPLCLPHISSYKRILTRFRLNYFGRWHCVFYCTMPGKHTVFGCCTLMLKSSINKLWGAKW